MKPAVEKKLNQMTARHAEINKLLSEPDVTDDLQRFRDLSKEYAQLEPFMELYKSYQANLIQLEEAKALLNEEDAEMQQLARQEIKHTEDNILRLEEELLFALLPRDPNDNNNIFLEIRAGAGGDEASIFAGDLFRMYSRFSETKGFKVEIISESHGEHGGYSVNLYAPLGAGGMKLSGNPGSATLVMSDGKVFKAASPDALLAKNWGFNLPVSYLRYWVRGLPVPGIPAKMSFDNFNRVTSFSQQGWQVEVQSYTRAGGAELPSRLSISSASLDAKLVVHEWHI